MCILIRKWEHDRVVRAEEFPCSTHEMEYGRSHVVLVDPQYVAGLDGESSYAAQPVC